MIFTWFMGGWDYDILVMCLMSLLTLDNSIYVYALYMVIGN